MLASIVNADLLVAIYAVTSDVGIATFVVHLIEASPEARGPYARSQGGGTHPCREIALLRALTEALQSGKVMPDDTVLMTSFGAGLTWATAVLQLAPKRVYEGDLLAQANGHIRQLAHH